jgi:hypothetical protein
VYFWVLYPNLLDLMPIHIKDSQNLGTKSFLFKNIVLGDRFNGGFKMPAKKTKKQRTEAKKAAANIEKTAVAGSADSTKGAADAGKTASGKGDSKKGRRK